MAETDFGKEVLNNISENKLITIKMPKQLAEEFVAFGKEHTQDCYWMAVAKLLDFYKQETEKDVKSQMLFNMILDLQNRISSLESKSNIQESNVKKEKGHFGSQENNEVK